MWEQDRKKGEQRRKRVTCVEMKKMKKIYLLVRVMSSCPSKSFMDSGRYFSTHGSCISLEAEEEEDDEEEDDEEEDDILGIYEAKIFE